MTSEEQNQKLWHLLLKLAANELGFPDVPPASVQRIRQKVLDQMRQRMGDYEFVKLIENADESKIIMHFLPRPKREPSKLTQFFLRHIGIIIPLGVIAIVSTPFVGPYILCVFFAIIAIGFLWQQLQVLKQMLTPLEIPVPPWGCEIVGVSYQCAGCGGSIKKYNRGGWATDYVSCSNSDCHVLLCCECAVMFTALRKLSATCPRCSAKLKILKEGTENYL